MFSSSKYTDESEACMMVEKRILCTAKSTFDSCIKNCKRVVRPDNWRMEAKYRSGGFCGKQVIYIINKDKDFYIINKDEDFKHELSATDKMARFRAELSDQSPGFNIEISCDIEHNIVWKKKTFSVKADEEENVEKLADDIGHSIGWIFYIEALYFDSLIQKVSIH